MSKTTLGAILGVAVLVLAATVALWSYQSTYSVSVTWSGQPEEKVTRGVSTENPVDSPSAEPGESLMERLFAAAGSGQPRPTGTNLRVHGIVKDAVTGEPVAGAWITPTPDLSALFSFGAAGPTPGDLQIDLEALKAAGLDINRMNPQGIMEHVNNPHSPAWKAVGTAPVQTDEDGAYTIALNPLLFSRLACAEPAHGKQTEKLPASGREEMEIDFLLGAGANISGHVRDAETGKPIPGARVRMTAQQRQSLLNFDFPGINAGETAKTDKDGAYVLASVKPGTYRIRATSQDTGHIFGEEDSRLLTVEESVAYDDIDFSGVQGAVVTGTIRTESGDPIERVHVSCRRPPSSMVGDLMSMIRSATTDKNGSYAINGLTYDVEYYIETSRADYPARCSGPFSVARGQSPMTIDLTLYTGTTVSGTARFPDGKAAANHDLMLQTRDSLADPFMHAGHVFADTDAKGRFTFDHVPAGEYTLTSIESPSFSRRDSDEYSVAVTTDGKRAVTGVDLVLPPGRATAVISGTVLNAQGSPAEGIRVKAKAQSFPRSSKETETDAGGAFEIRDVSAMTYTVIAIGKEGSAKEEGVTAGSQVTLRLTKPIRIEGTVFDANNTPAPRSTVTLQGGGASGIEDLFAAVSAPLGGPLGRAKPQTVTDEEGRFEFANVEPGEHAIAVENATLGIANAGPFVLQPGEELKGIRIELEEWLRFSGAVVDSDRRPIAQATIQLRPSSDNSSAEAMQQSLSAGLNGTDATTMTDNGGAFIITSVKPGVYTLTASHPDYAKSIHRRLELPPGSDVEGYEILLSQGGTATGQYLVNGQPKADIMIQLAGDGGSYKSNTDPEGRFEITGIPEGAYMAMPLDMNAIMSGEYDVPQVSRRNLVDIFDGQTTIIDFEPPVGVTVSGAITGRALGQFASISLRELGSPDPTQMSPGELANSGVELLRDQAGQGVIAEDGTFSMDYVEPGTYVLSVVAVFPHAEAGDTDASLSLLTEGFTQEVVLSQEITIGGEPIALNLEIPGVSASP